jgi:hypothetical protein
MAPVGGDMARSAEQRQRSMRTHRYHLLAIIMLMVAVLVLFRQRKVSDDPSERAGSDGISQTIVNSPDVPSSWNTRLATKTKIRNPHRKPTRDETIRLVQETVFPVFDLPGQTLGERVEELNRLVGDCGVEPGQLTFVMDPDGSRPDRLLSDFRCEEIRIRNLPLGEALKYIQDSTILNYEVVPERVEFFLHSSVRDDRWRDAFMEKMENRAMTPQEAADPFAEAGAE